MGWHRSGNGGNPRLMSHHTSLKPNPNLVVREVEPNNAANRDFFAFFAASL